MNEKHYLKDIFEDVIGQSIAKKFLCSALEKEKIAPAYLFSGPEGVGRKLSAIRFLEGLIFNESKEINMRKRLENNNHPDVLWIEPTYIYQKKLITKTIAEKEKISFRALPQIRLEQIKNVKSFFSKKPIKSNLCMVVIEDIEMMNEAAANSLLKTLEEPKNGLFILITAKPESIIHTIRSRCQQIIFNRLSTSELQKVFQENDKFKSIDRSILKDQKELLVLGNGSPGSILKNIEFWQNIPEKIWPSIQSLPYKNPVDSLSTAKEVTESLDYQQQIWLISWIQQNLWEKEMSLESIKVLEKLKSNIQSFVNQRLAWEIALLQLK